MFRSKYTQEMDPKIWSKLPEELLDKILCYLPLKHIFNLRSTCKRFKSLLFNPFFISQFSSSNFSSFILLSHPHFNSYFPLYDTVLGSWKQGRSPVSRSLINPCTSSTSLLSSSNGLLCFYLPSTFSFLVTNLLSLSSILIKFPKLPFSYELLTLISYPDGFKLFAYSSKNVFLYDSRAQSWAEYDGFEPIMNDNFHQEGVHHNGFLHFTTSDPFSIVSFDLNNGGWLRHFNEMPTNEFAFLRLASGESMYLIGGVGRNGISSCLKVWELVGNEWVEIETLPDLMYKKLVSVCYHNYEHIYCFLHQGLICICCYNWPEILYYKVSRRTWHWLPKCPFLSDKWSCGFRWFSFVPRLYATV